MSSSMHSNGSHLKCYSRAPASRLYPCSGYIVFIFDRKRTYVRSTYASSSKLHVFLWCCVSIRFCCSIVVWLHVLEWKGNLLYFIHECMASCTKWRLAWICSKFYTVVNSFIRLLLCLFLFSASTPSVFHLVFAVEISWTRATPAPVVAFIDITLHSSTSWILFL